MSDSSHPPGGDADPGDRLPPPRHDRRLTEQRNPRSEALDTMSTAEALALMQDEDEAAVRALRDCAPAIEQAIDCVARAFERGGRLFYIGAGTSGRLGVLDASEQPPTFGVPPELVQGIVAGGPDALTRSIEGAEDRAEEGVAAVAKRGIDERDVAFGITTGGRAPYVLAALAEARRRGAATILLSCTPPMQDEETLADIQIHALVGPEIVTGSTRLKAGTATKLILNRVTTLAMVRTGKVYRNLMVDLRPVNIKLVDRACRILRELVGVESDEAERLLRESGNELKVALVMGLAGVDAADARTKLETARGHVARALRGLEPPCE